MLGLSAAPPRRKLVGMVWMPESPAWLAGKGLRRQAEEIARRTGVAADEAEGGRTGASRRLFEGEASDVPLTTTRRRRSRPHPPPTPADGPSPRLSSRGRWRSSDDRRVRSRACARARTPPATPPGGDPSGAAAGGGYQRGDVLRRDDHSSRGGLRRRRRRPPRPRRRRHVRPRFRPRSPRRGRVRTTPSAPRVALGMRRRVGGARVLFSGRRPGTLIARLGNRHGDVRGRRDVPRVPRRVVRVLRRGRGRGTPGGAWWAQPRDRTARGGRRNTRGVRRGATRGRRTPSRGRRRRRRRSTSSTSEADAASFEAFLATAGDEGGAPPRRLTRRIPRRPPDRASRGTPRASEHRHLRRPLAVSLVSFAARSPRARRADAVRDVVSGGDVARAVGGGG